MNGIRGTGTEPVEGVEGLKALGTVTGEISEIAGMGWKGTGTGTGIARAP